MNDKLTSNDDRLFYALLAEQLWSSGLHDNSSELNALTNGKFVREREFHELDLSPRGVYVPLNLIIFISRRPSPRAMWALNEYSCVLEERGCGWDSSRGVFVVLSGESSTKDASGVEKWRFRYSNLFERGSGFWWWPRWFPAVNCTPASKNRSLTSDQELFCNFLSILASPSRQCGCAQTFPACVYAQPAIGLKLHLSSTLMALASLFGCCRRPFSRS